MIGVGEPRRWSLDYYFAMTEERPRGLFQRPIDAIASAVVPVVADAVEPDDLLERIDVNALLERVDIDALLDRIDLDAVMQRVDLDKLMARVDIDAIAERVDVNAIADAVDIDRILQRSTKGVSDRFIDLFRRQIVGLDEIGMRTLSRLFRRDPNLLPAGPPALVESAEASDKPTTMSGRYAGPLSRLGALALDLFFISSSFTLLAAGVQFLWNTMLGGEQEFTSGDSFWLLLAIGLYGFLYFWVSASLSGRTVAQAIVGLKVVQGDGTPITPGHAFVRALVLPFSFMLLGIGALMMLFDRRRRALHDFAARSSVVYDWGDRPALLPAPLTRFLDSRNSVTLAVAADPVS